MLTERQAELLQTLEETFESMNSTSNDDFFFLDEVFEKSGENKKKVDEIKAYNKAFKEGAIESFKEEVGCIINTIKNRYDFLSSLECIFTNYGCNVYNHYTKDGVNLRRRLFGIGVNYFMNTSEETIFYNEYTYQRLSHTAYILRSDDESSTVSSKSLDSLFRSDYFKRIMRKVYERRA